MNRCASLFSSLDVNATRSNDFGDSACSYLDQLLIGSLENLLTISRTINRMSMFKMSVIACETTRPFCFVLERFILLVKADKVFAMTIVDSRTW